MDTPSHGNQNDLLNYKLDTLFKNVDELKGSIKEVSSSVQLINSQQIGRGEWLDAQNTIRGLSIWRWMMAGAIAMLTFGVPIVMAIIIKMMRP